MQSKEVSYCKNLLFVLGSDEKRSLIEKSNLNEREKKLVSLRFVDGKPIKDCCDELGIEIDALNKAQAKALLKLYFWINNKDKITMILTELFVTV